MYGSIENNTKKIKDIKDASTMLVKFDSYKGRIAGGRVQTLYYRHPFRFSSLGQLLLMIDDVLDSVEFQKEPEDSRHLYEEGNAPVFQETDPEDLFTDEDICKKNYENPFHAEVSVRILGRQNSSMQGEVCADGRVISFRSALELLRTLYEFLEKGHGGEGAGKRVVVE